MRLVDGSSEMMRSGRDESLGSKQADGQGECGENGGEQEHSDVEGWLGEEAGGCAGRVPSGDQHQDAADDGDEGLMASDEGHELTADTDGEGGHGQGQLVV